jgi:hypothetical protein
MVFLFATNSLKISSEETVKSAGSSAETMPLLGSFFREGKSAGAVLAAVVSVSFCLASLCLKYWQEMPKIRTIPKTMVIEREFSFVINLLLYFENIALLTSATVSKKEVKIFQKIDFLAD